MKDEEKPQIINPLIAIREEDEEKAKMKAAGFDDENEYRKYSQQLYEEEKKKKLIEKQQRQKEEAQINLEKEDQEQQHQQEEEKALYKSVRIKGGVDINSFDMPFEEMVAFIFKWTMASIPTAIFLAILFLIFTAIIS